MEIHLYFQEGKGQRMIKKQQVTVGFNHSPLPS